MTYPFLRARASAPCAALVLAALLPGLACRPEPPARTREAPDPADLQAIARLREEFRKAHNDGDSGRLAALFTEDAVLIPEDDATCEGRKEIAGYFSDFLDQGPATLQFEPKETQILGDWAYVRIDVTLTTTDASTGEQDETWERFLWIVVREPGGSWKISRAIANVEEPDDEDGGGDFHPET